MKKPKLTRRQVAHVRFRERMRRKYSLKATAALMGVTTATILNYMAGICIPLEDWEEQIAVKRSLNGPGWYKQKTAEGRANAFRERPATRRME